MQKIKNIHLNYLISIIFFYYLYRFLVFSIEINEVAHFDLSELQVYALKNHFFETIWFYGTLPLGNFILLKISTFFVILSIHNNFAPFIFLAKLKKSSQTLTKYMLKHY